MCQSIFHLGLLAHVVDMSIKAFYFCLLARAVDEHIKLGELSLKQICENAARHLIKNLSRQWVETGKLKKMK